MLVREHADKNAQTQTHINDIPECMARSSISYIKSIFISCDLSIFSMNLMMISEISSSCSKNIVYEGARSEKKMKKQQI
jgi:hypothetical protein